MTIDVIHSIWFVLSPIWASASPVRCVPTRKKSIAKKGVIPKIEHVNLLRFSMPVSARVKIAVV